MVIQIEQDAIRGCLKNRPRSFWGQTFASLSPLDSELESHAKKVEVVKVKVKNMLLNSTKELTYNIKFINLLCRLGVSYHFEDEIKQQLNHIFIVLPELLENNDFDICTLANMFRVLRQYGHKMSCDVFKKFRGEDGKFNEDIVKDVEGILSLHEACFLAIPGEEILDEAFAFTQKHLEILANNSSPHLQTHIRKSLMYPSHRTIERLDALNYIMFYEEEEFADATLLKFAKLDYNGLQLLYRKELALLSKWWKDLNVAENLPYARDRLVEAYMWAVGFIFEPQYSLSRMFICKYISVLTPVDDTYDSYGTIDELQLLTTALQRFTIKDVDELPEYMKFLYKLVFELVENSGTQACSCKTTFAREMIKELAIGYNVEAIWLKEKKAATFDEYMNNGNVTSTYNILTSAFILGAENISMKEILWLRNDPKIVNGAKFHPRFLNDINGVRTDETNRGDCLKAVDCYMLQYGASQDEAIKAILKILDNKWKGMNEDFLETTSIPRIFLKYTFNFARTGIFFYQGTDFFTYGHNMKQHITSLFINPLPM